MKRTTSTVRLPSIEKAVEIYYTKPELISADICELFGCVRSTALRIRQPVLDEMIRQNVHCWTAGAVSTRIAYQVWGIDITDYEQRLAKLRKLGMLRNEEGSA